MHKYLQKIKINKLRLPNFIVIGTQKGGTTSLYEVLKKHPGIYLNDRKELHYFSTEYNNELKWYSDHFKEAKRNQKCGDITPFYLFHKESAKRIRDTTPNARLIVLLRDPVERTLSQYFHARRHGFETLCLREALEKEEKRLSTGNIYNIQKHSYLTRSKYMDQLMKYEKYFPKKQMLVLKSEDFFEKVDSDS